LCPQGAAAVLSRDAQEQDDDTGKQPVRPATAGAYPATDPVSHERFPPDESRAKDEATYVYVGWPGEAFGLMSCRALH
jgi:hypothetical protein